MLILAQAVASRPELIDGIGTRILAWVNSIRGKPADTGLDRWRQTLMQLESVSLGRRDMGVAFSWSMFNWIADVACLGFAAYAAGDHASVAGLTVAYAAARAVGTIPLMPGGLLVVEAVLVPGLVSSGMSLPNAISAMLIYRLISWLLISAIGWVVFFFVFRTENVTVPDEEDIQPAPKPRSWTRRAPPPTPQRPRCRVRYRPTGTPKLGVSRTTTARSRCRDPTAPPRGRTEREVANHTASRRFRCAEGGLVGWLTKRHDPCVSIDADLHPAGHTPTQPSGDSSFTSIPQMRAVYESQLRSHLKDGPPDLSLRKDRLDRLAVTLSENVDDIVDAICADFGNRPGMAALAAEVLLQLRDIRTTKKHLRQWMGPRRPQPWWFRAIGIDAWVEPTPLGVVGVISPWNFPLGLTVQPAIAAIAAGNRVMLKASELTPRTSAAMRGAFARRFSPEELAVIIGGPQLGAAFTALPLDHIFFTGSSAVGKQVQRAAADNLTPVTLELGGKNPAVVAPDAELRRAVPRIVKARLANSGQICLSPDYVLVPRRMEKEFVTMATAAACAALPTFNSNRDVCTIINEKHYLRVVAQIDDARARGATVHQVLPDGETEPPAAARRIPLTLITSVTDDMAIMQDEIFGPVLPVIPYDTVEEVIDFVNDRPAPLGSYWFGPDSTEFRMFVRRTRSGGVTRNDFALHATVEGLPFGGVGHSGTGYYHGKYGFDTFSHLRAVAISPRAYSPAGLLSPPYSAALERGLRVAAQMWGRATSRRIKLNTRQRWRGSY